MNYRTKSIISLLLIFLILPLFTSCSSKSDNISTIKSDSSFQKISETMKAKCFKMSYENFDGSEIRTISVDKGNTIILNYNSQVKEGTLTIQINDPYGNLLTNLPVNKSGEYKFAVKGNGKITMIVTGKNTSGSFELYWKKTWF